MHVWLRTGKDPLLGLRLYSSGTSESLNSLDSGVGQRTLFVLSLLFVDPISSVERIFISQLLKMAICFHSITAMELWAEGGSRCLGVSKPLVGGIPSDTCSAYRLCGVATKPPLQTFVFDRQKKTRVCQRLIRRL